MCSVEVMSARRYLLATVEKEIPQLRHLKPLITKENVVEAMSKEFGCSCESILKNGSKKNTARDMAIYLARDVTGESCKSWENILMAYPEPGSL